MSKNIELKNMDASYFLTKENLACIIENYVRDENLTHFEAVIAFCEENNKEFEDIVRMFTPTLLEKVRQSSREMGLMPLEPSIDGLK